MRNLFLIIGLAVILSGCAAGYALVERDLDSAIVMAKAHGEKLEVQCFEAMKQGAAKLKEISKLDSDGAIASTYKAWLLSYYKQLFRRQAAQFCVPVVAGMGAHLMIR